MIGVTTLLSILFEPGIFTNDPVRTAAVIGAAAAIVSGVVGVFTVIRGQSFAGHALADVSSAGGAAAFLLGINPLLGFLGMGVLAATSMEVVRVDRASERDLVTGVVTGAGLGLAALLLYLDVTISSTTGVAVTVMFGSIFAIPSSLVLRPCWSEPGRWSRSACSSGRCCSVRSIRTLRRCAGFRFV